MRKTIGLTVLVLLLCGVAHGTDYTWDAGAVTRNYDNSQVWDPIGVPGHTTNPAYGADDTAHMGTSGAKCYFPNTNYAGGAHWVLYIGQLTGDNGRFEALYRYGGGHDIYVLDDNGESGDFLMTGSVVWDVSGGSGYGLNTLEADGHVRVQCGTGSWTPVNWHIVMNGGTGDGDRKELELEQTGSTRPWASVTVSDGAWVEDKTNAGNNGRLWTNRLTVNGNFKGSAEAGTFVIGPSGVWDCGTAYLWSYESGAINVYVYGGTYPVIDSMRTTPGSFSNMRRMMRVMGDVTCEDLLMDQYTTSYIWAVNWHDKFDTDNGAGQHADIHVKGELRVGGGTGNYSNASVRPTDATLGFYANSSTIRVDGNASFGRGAYVVGGTSRWEFGGNVVFGPEAVVGAVKANDVWGFFYDNSDMSQTTVVVNGSGTQVLDFDRKLALGNVEIAQTASTIQMDDNMLLYGNLKFTSASTVIFTNEGDAFIFGGGIDNDTGQRIDVAAGVDLINVSIIPRNPASYVYLDSDLIISDNLNIGAACKLFLNGYTLTLEGTPLASGDIGEMSYDEGTIVGSGVIPEPATLLLVGSGLLGVLGVARRRRMR